MKVITSTMFSMKRGELRLYPKHANAFKSSTPKRHWRVYSYCLNTGLYIWSISISCPLDCSVMTFNMDNMDMQLQSSKYKYCSIIIVIIYYHHYYVIFPYSAQGFHTFVNIHVSYCKRPKRYNMWSIINFFLGVRVRCTCVNIRLFDALPETGIK